MYGSGSVPEEYQDGIKTGWEAGCLALAERLREVVAGHSDNTIVREIYERAMVIAKQMAEDGPTGRRSRIGAVEGVPAIEYEDGGQAMIAEVDDPTVDWYVRIQSYSEEPRHPIEELLRDRRVRVVVEVLD